MTSIEMLDGDFATLPDLVRAHAAERPDAVAAADPSRRLSWSELDQLTDRIAARLQQDGFAKVERTAIAGLNSVEQMAAIGRAHVCTPVTNAHLVCRHLLEKNKQDNQHH